MRISDWSSDVCSSDLSQPVRCGVDGCGQSDHNGPKDPGSHAVRIAQEATGVEENRHPQRDDQDRKSVV